MQLKALSGRGGPPQPSQPRQPRTDRDSLNSTQSLDIFDVFSAGEIEGFPSSRGLTPFSGAWQNAILKDIYLNKTPILRKEASNTSPAPTDFNFKGINKDVRLGTQSQPAILGVPSAQSELGVGVEVRNSTPVTRTITDPNVEAVRVTLTWDRLEWFQKDGDIKKRRVDYSIQFSYDGGPFVEVARDFVNGRSPDRVQRTLTVPLNGDFPVQVRVLRNSPDSSDPTRILDAFTWSSYTEIQYAKFRYPGTAYAFLRFDAKDFSSVPSRAYRLRGVKVKIPSNATVDSETGRLTFSGIWDGNFSVPQWCRDPAWILYYVLTDKFNGLGDWISESALDKWSFYAASVYNNGLVPSGIGDELEARYFLDVSIQEDTSAFKVINDICSSMDVQPYWSANGIVIVQDRPSDIVQIFNQSRTTDGRFEYSGSSLTQRHSVANVAWLDLDLQETAYEVAEDEEAVKKYGYNVVEVKAYGCTRRSQARRKGRMTIATEQTETEVVVFKTPMDGGVEVRPGMVIGISDPLKVGGRQGGRVRAATTTSVRIDIPVANLPSTSVGNLTVALASGGVESREVVSESGETLVVSPAFSSLPLVGGPYIYADSISQWRVINVQEQDGIEYAITALAYNPDKYAFVEANLPLDEDRLLATENLKLRVSPLVVEVKSERVRLIDSENITVSIQAKNLETQISGIKLIDNESLVLSVSPATLEAVTSGFANSILILTVSATVAEVVASAINLIEAEAPSDAGGSFNLLSLDFELLDLLENP